MLRRKSPKGNCPKIENHILYARIQSSVLRSELFYQREALKEEINRRSGVRLVNAVIIR